MERAPYNPHWKFDTKLASLPAYQYDSNDTPAWLKKVKNYFTGQCPDSKLLMDWAEQQGNNEIPQSTVKALAGSLCLDADPVAVSQGMWSWLQQPFQPSS